MPMLRIVTMDGRECPREALEVYNISLGERSEAFEPVSWDVFTAMVSDRDHQALLVLDPLDTVVAMALMESSEDGILQMLAVRPEYQGKGIGSWLFEHILTQMKALGVRAMMAGVREDSELTQKWYRALGGVIDKHKPLIGDTGEVVLPVRWRVRCKPNVPEMFSLE
jgi:ribosomal protein S18 acetylase RimI-like enzyme